MDRSAYAWRVGIFASMGGLLFGYDWSVIGGVKPLYEPYFGIDAPAQAWISGWVMSSAIVGCLLGACISVVVADRIGRKKTLLIAAYLFLISAVASAFANSISWFVLARIVGGFAIGLASCVSPLYIAEIAPREIRGKLVATNQMAIVLGILFAQLVNLLIFSMVSDTQSTNPEMFFQSWHCQYGWRWMLGAEAIPAGVFVALMWFVPESPRWLIQQGKLGDALAVLRRTEGKRADQIALEIQNRIKPEDGNHQKNRPRVLESAANRYILWVGITLAVLQQWCGINVIFNYADDILRQAGLPLSKVMFGIVLTGVVNFVFTLISLQTIDRWGRRPLMIFGAAGLCCCFAWLGLSYHLKLSGAMAVGSLLFAISIYAMTLAPVTWVLLAEMFPISLRGTMMSLSVAALWLACFVLTITFKPLNAYFGAAPTFWLYSFICLLGTCFVYFHVPETKGKSLESIEADFVSCRNRIAKRS